MTVHDRTRLIGLLFFSLLFSLSLMSLHGQQAARESHALKELL